MAIHKRNCSVPLAKEMLICMNNAKLISSFLELCLTSNIKCGTVESYKKHHFIHLFTAKHPVVLAVSIGQKEQLLCIISMIPSQRNITPLHVVISK